MRFAILLTALLLTGCAKSAKPQHDRHKSSSSPKSTAEQVIDGITGRKAVQAGKKARETIERVSNERNKNLDEILE